MIVTFAEFLAAAELSFPGAESAPVIRSPLDRG